MVNTKVCKEQFLGNLGEAHIEVLKEGGNTFRFETLIPTSSDVMPTLVKNITMAERSSASACNNNTCGLVGELQETPKRRHKSLMITH